jgi:hypothetical protein
MVSDKVLNRVHAFVPLDVREIKCVTKPLGSGEVVLERFDDLTNELGVRIIST